MKENDEGLVQSIDDTGRMVTPIERINEEFFRNLKIENESFFENIRFIINKHYDHINQLLNDHECNVQNMRLLEANFSEVIDTLADEEVEAIDQLKPQSPKTPRP